MSSAPKTAIGTSMASATAIGSVIGGTLPDAAAISPTLRA